MRRILLALLMAVTLGVFGIDTAHAQDSETIQKVQGHFDSGATFYEQGQYEKAIEEFQAGYALFPDPIFLYNISLAHGKLGRVNESLAVAELAESMGLQEPDQSQNRARMVALRSVQSGQDVSDELGVVARKTASEDKKRRTAEDNRQLFSTYGWIGVGTASAGLVALVSSLLIDLSMGGDIEAYESAAARGDESEYGTLKDDIESSQTTAQILFFSGVALTAVGGGLIVWDLMRDQETEDTVARAMVVPTPDGAAINISATW